MRRIMTVCKLWILVVLCDVLCSLAQAQLPQTRLYVLAPSSGQSGHQTTVTIESGEDLDEVAQLVFSHPGITAVHTPAPQDSPSGPATRTFTVNIAGDVPPGSYEVTCQGRFGISNPRQFVVGTRPEIASPESNQTVQTSYLMPLGKVVQGCLKLPQEVDWYQFVGKQGQRVILDCWAERIDSRLKPVLVVYDAAGRRRLASSARQQSSDPVVVFDVPADGTYQIKLHDVTYRSGIDYRYRLELHTAPQLEFALPSILQAGTTGKVTVYGFNLPGGVRTQHKHRDAELEALEVEIAAPTADDTFPADHRISALQAASDAFHYRFHDGESISNPIRFGISSLPVLAEREPNNTPAESQALTLPLVVDGQFDKLHDQDRFRFAGQAGQKITIDVVSERLGFSADPVVKLERVIQRPDQSESFVLVIEQDDNSGNLNPGIFETQTSDPTMTIALPESGLYQITLQDRYWEVRGDQSLNYQMSVRENGADFRVVAVPGATTSGQVAPVGLRLHDRYPIALYLFRKNGFDGDVTVDARDLPPGIDCPSTTIRRGVNSACMIVTAQGENSPIGMDLRLTAQAELRIDSEHPAQSIEHPVRMATVVWSQNGTVPAECRMSARAVISIQNESAPCMLSSSVTEIDALPGGMARWPITVQRNASANESIQLSVQELPASLIMDQESAMVAAGAQTHELHLLLGDDIAPGRYSVWARGESIVSYRRNPEAADRMNVVLQKEIQVLEQLRASAAATTQLIAEADAQLATAMKKMQEQQAAVAQAMQVVTLTQTAIERLMIVVREAADRLQLAEQQLARSNQQLVQIQANLRLLEERRSVCEANVKQVYQQVSDARNRLADMTLKVDLGSDSEHLIKDAQSQVKATEALLMQETVKFQIGRWMLISAQLQLKNQSARQQAAMARHNDLFQAHEAARQSLAMEKQKLADSEAAHRAAVQMLMAAQKNASVAEADRAKAVAAEQQTLADVEKQEEIKRRVKVRATEVAKAAEPRPLRAVASSARMTINVLSSPIKASFIVSTTGLGHGAPIPVQCQVQRLHDFAGPVSFILHDPLSGIAAETLRLDSSETTGNLMMTLPTDVASGTERTVFLKVSANHDGQDYFLEKPIRFSVP